MLIILAVGMFQILIVNPARPTAMATALPARIIIAAPHRAAVPVRPVTVRIPRGNVRLMPAELRRWSELATMIAAMRPVAAAAAVLMIQLSINVKWAVATCRQIIFTP